MRRCRVVKRASNGIEMAWLVGREVRATGLRAGYERVATAMTTSDAGTGVAMPLVVDGPWTHEAREQAAAREAHQAFVRYFRKAMKFRNWTPWDDIPLAEMHQYGHLLSEDTITIIQAYLGVEDYVGDYVEDGLNIL